MRVYRSDNWSVILVNGHMVKVAKEGEDGYTNINDFFRSDGPNYVTVITVNSGGPGAWGFYLRHNQTIVWGNEGSSGAEMSIIYAQTLQVLPDDKVIPVDRDFSRKALGGAWTARLQAYDMGLLLINDIPVLATFPDRDMGWVEIGGYLYADQDNEIAVMVWNFADTYGWDVAIQKEGTIIWGSNNKGTGQTGEVFYLTVTIDKQGQLIAQ